MHSFSRISWNMNKQRFGLLRFEFGPGSVRVRIPILNGRKGGTLGLCKTVHADACCLLASPRAKGCIGTALTCFPADCVSDSNPLAIDSRVQPIVCSVDWPKIQPYLGAKHPRHS